VGVEDADVLVKLGPPARHVWVARRAGPRTDRLVNCRQTGTQRLARRREGHPPLGRPALPRRLRPSRSARLRRPGCGWRWRTRAGAHQDQLAQRRAQLYRGGRGRSHL